MDSKDNKRGFSGLSDLASEVSGVEDFVGAEPDIEAKSSSANQTSPSTPQASPPTETTGSGKSGGGLGWIWIYVIVSIIFVNLVVWFANLDGQSTTKPSYNTPSPSKNFNFPQNSPATVDTTSAVTKNTGLNYEKPPVGTNNVLSVPQIRWCAREEIRIDAMRDFIDTNYKINEFNKIVNDYNSRCGSFQYRQGALQQALRDVEDNRSQIVAEVVMCAGKPGRANQPTYSSVSPKKFTRSETKESKTQLTKDVQQILIELGYDPGPIDGQYSRQTANAVKDVQRDMGIDQDGCISEGLLNSLILRRLAAEY